MRRWDARTDSWRSSLEWVLVSVSHSVERYEPPGVETEPILVADGSQTHTVRGTVKPPHLGWPGRSVDRLGRGKSVGSGPDATTAEQGRASSGRPQYSCRIAARSDRCQAGSGGDGARELCLRCVHAFHHPPEDGLSRRQNRGLALTSSVALTAWLTSPSALTFREMPA